MSKPVPKPRSHIPAKQYIPPPLCSMSVDLEDEPPPLPPKPQKMDRKDGQAGMSRSISLPERENVYQNLKTELEKISLDYEGSPTLQPFSEATNSTSERIVERTTVPERVIVTQKSLDEAHQRRLALKQSATRRLTDYRPNLTTPCFSRCVPKETEADEDPENWWRTVKPWDEVSNDHYLLQAKAPKEFAEKAQRVRKAFLFYKHLMYVHGSALQELISELLQISGNLNKVFKGAKIAGITGGAAGAAGVAAVVGGVLLAPLTMGASLAVAAVGVGVAAAGGVTGASAAITNKVNNTMDRKKVEKILQDYMTHMEDIEKCVKFINIGVEHLKDYNLSELHGVDKEAVKVARVAKMAWGTVGATSAISKSSGLIQGFSVGLNIYFTKNDKQKLKKGSEAKFAKQIRQVAEAMKASLDELMKVKEELELEDI